MRVHAEDLKARLERVEGHNQSQELEVLRLMNDSERIADEKSEADKQIVRLGEKATARQNELDRLSTELKAIEGSLWWRMVFAIRRLRSKIAGGVRRTSND